MAHGSGRAVLTVRLRRVREPERSRGCPADSPFRNIHCRTPFVC